jgi:hypothetical protein
LGILQNFRRQNRKNTGVHIVYIGFLVGGVFFITNLTIWQPIVMVSAIFSSMIYLLFWDGKMKKLGDKGGFGILINIAILAGLIVF